MGDTQNKTKTQASKETNKQNIRATNTLETKKYQLWKKSQMQPRSKTTSLLKTLRAACLAARIQGSRLGGKPVEWEQR